MHTTQIIFLFYYYFYTLSWPFQAISGGVDIIIIIIIMIVFGGYGANEQWIYSKKKLSNARERAHHAYYTAD